MKRGSTKYNGRNWEGEKERKGKGKERERDLKVVTNEKGEAVGEVLTIIC